MENHRLEKWLGMLGSFSPGPAMEIVSTIANHAANEGPLGSDFTRTGAIAIRTDGHIELRGHQTSSSPEDDMSHMGRLLFELITGKSWQVAPGIRNAQFEDAYRLLSMWPGGEEAYALLTELIDRRAEKDPRHLAIRISECRANIGGADLPTMLRKAKQTGAKTNYDDFESPDSLTGTYPAGTLANLLSSGSDEVRQAAAQATHEDATPVPPEDDLQSILKDFGVGSSNAPTRPPAPKRVAKKRRSTIPLWLIAALGLAVLSIAGLIILLLIT